MSNKLNVLKIISDHVNTLRNFDTGRYSPVDFSTFFVLPALLSGILLWVFKIGLSPDIVNVLITSLSIFAALLFNLLLLIYDIVRDPQKITDPSGIKGKYLRQIYANVSFCILISLIGVIVLLLAFFDLRGVSIGTVVSPITVLITFIVYYLGALFILTLLMVLKRVHILLSKEFGAS